MKYISLTVLKFFLFFIYSADSCYAETNFSTIEERRSRLLEWADVKYKASDHYLSKAYWMLGDTAVNGCKQEYSNHIVDFKNWSNDNGKSIDHFVLPVIVRYLYQFEHCMSKQHIEVLRDFVANGPCCDNNEYLGHGTLNHAILQASSWYLLAQYFNKDIWIRRNNGEYTSEQIKDTIYNNLINRFTQHISHGHFEIASPNYIESNFFPLMNLIDFSSNATIKSLAEQEAYKTLEYLKTNSFKGRLIPPLTRQVSGEFNGSVEEYWFESYSIGLDKRLYWYYFGPELELSLGDFNSGKSPSFWIIYVLSEWLPENLYDDGGLSNLTTELINDEIPTWSQWGEDLGTEIFSQKFIGENYALAASKRRYFPYWYSGNVVEFGILLDSDNIFNQIDCTQPYWYSNYSTELESNYKIRWYDRGSPFMQTHLINNNNMLLIGNIPETDPFTQFETEFTKHRSSNVDSLAQFIRCRIPKHFDVIDKGERVIKISEGKTYIQITSLNQNFVYQTDDYFQYFILEGGKSALHFYVTDEVTSMAELSNKINQYTVSYNSEENQILFTAPDQSNQVKMTFNNVLYQDSDSNLAEREIMYESIPLIEEVSQ